MDFTVVGRSLPTRFGNSDKCLPKLKVGGLKGGPLSLASRTSSKTSNVGSTSSKTSKVGSTSSKTSKIGSPSPKTPDNGPSSPKTPQVLPSPTTSPKLADGARPSTSAEIEVNASTSGDVGPSSSTDSQIEAKKVKSVTKKKGPPVIRHTNSSRLRDIRNLRGTHNLTLGNRPWDPKEGIIEFIPLMEFLATKIAEAEKIKRKTRLPRPKLTLKERVFFGFISQDYADAVERAERIAWEDSKIPPPSADAETQYEEGDTEPGPDYWELPKNKVTRSKIHWRKAKYMFGKYDKEIPHLHLLTAKIEDKEVGVQTISHELFDFNGEGGALAEKLGEDIMTCAYSEVEFEEKMKWGEAYIRREEEKHKEEQKKLGRIRSAVVSHNVVMNGLIVEEMRKARENYEACRRICARFFAKSLVQRMSSHAIWDLNPPGVITANYWFEKLIGMGGEKKKDNKAAIAGQLQDDLIRKVVADRIMELEQN